MAEFNTGIIGPQEKVMSLSSPEVFQETAPVISPVDWTRQESTIFAALANSIPEAIGTWKKLEAQQKDIELEKVKNEYSQTLERYKLESSLDQNISRWSEKKKDIPPGAIAPRPYDPNWERETSEEFLARNKKPTEPAPAPVTAPTTSDPRTPEMIQQERFDSDPRLISQYDPKDTEAIKKQYGPPGSGLIASKVHLIKRIREEEKQKQRDAGYPEHWVNGETRRYIEANWALFGEDSFQTNDDLINSWRTQ